MLSVLFEPRMTSSFIQFHRASSSFATGFPTKTAFPSSARSTSFSLLVSTVEELIIETRRFNPRRLGRRRVQIASVIHFMSFYQENDKICTTIHNDKEIIRASHPKLRQRFGRKLKSVSETRAIGSARHGSQHRPLKDRTNYLLHDLQRIHPVPAILRCHLLQQCFLGK